MSTDRQSAPASPDKDSDRGSPPEDQLIIDGISYIPSSALLTGIPKLSSKSDRAFGVLDPRGEAPRIYASPALGHPSTSAAAAAEGFVGSTGSELGFYFNDTRYLAVWEMTFNGTAPIALSNE